MMKKVVALKNYTDPYYIFREGMIYNLENSVANKFVALGVMTEGTPDDVVITSASTSGTQIADIKINGQSNKIYTPAGGGGVEVLKVYTEPIYDDNDDEEVIGMRLDHTYQQILEAKENGIVEFYDVDGIYTTQFYCALIMTPSAGQSDLDPVIDNNLYIRVFTIVDGNMVTMSFKSATVDDYPISQRD